MKGRGLGVCVCVCSEKWLNGTTVGRGLDEECDKKKTPKKRGKKKEIKR